LLFFLFAVFWPAGIYLIWKKIKLEPVDFSKPIRLGLMGGKAEIIYSVFFLLSSSVALVSSCLKILSQGSRTLPAGWLLVGDVSHSPLHCLAGSSANTACFSSAASATVNINAPVYRGTSKDYSGHPCKK
jgi:hypothetical protein